MNSWGDSTKCCCLDLDEGAINLNSPELSEVWTRIDGDTTPPSHHFIGTERMEGGDPEQACWLRKMKLWAHFILVVIPPCFCFVPNFQFCTHYGSRLHARLGWMRLPEPLQIRNDVRECFNLHALSLWLPRQGRGIPRQIRLLAFPIWKSRRT